MLLEELELARGRLRDHHGDVQDRAAAEVQREAVMPPNLQRLQGNGGFRHELVRVVVHHRQQNLLAVELVLGHLHGDHLVPDRVTRLRHRTRRRARRQARRRLAHGLRGDEGSRRRAVCRVQVGRAVHQDGNAQRSSRAGPVPGGHLPARAAVRVQHGDLQRELRGRPTLGVLERYRHAHRLAARQALHGGSEKLHVALSY